MEYIITATNSSGMRDNGRTAESTVRDCQLKIPVAVHVLQALVEWYLAPGTD
jgi:hypothetical protein